MASIPFMYPSLANGDLFVDVFDLFPFPFQLIPCSLFHSVLRVPVFVALTFSLITIADTHCFAACQCFTSCSSLCSEFNVFVWTPLLMYIYSTVCANSIQVATGIVDYNKLVEYI